MRRLGETIQQIAAQEEKIRQANVRRTDVLSQLQSAPQTRLHLSTIASGSRAVLRLRGEIMKQREMLAGLKAEAERRRGELLVATQEKRKLEKLRERLRERHHDEQRRVDSVEQDEIAGQSGLFRKRQELAELTTT